MRHIVDAIGAVATADGLGALINESINIAEARGQELVDVKFQASAVSDDTRDGLYYSALIVYALSAQETAG